MGDPAAAKPWATQALALSHNETVGPATVLAFTGDIPQSQKIIDEQAKVRPQDTVLKLFDIPQVQTAIAIKSGKPASAIEKLRPGQQYENGAIEMPFYRGLTYYSMKSGKEAAAEFAKAKALRTTKVVNPLLSVNQLYLARAVFREAERLNQT